MADPIFISLDQFPALRKVVLGQSMKLTMNAKVSGVFSENGQQIVSIDIDQLDMSELQKLSVQQTLHLQEIQRNTGAVNTPTP